MIIVCARDSEREGGSSLNLKGGFLCVCVIIIALVKSISVVVLYSSMYYCCKFKFEFTT